jgi:hypothetical protein
MRPDSRSSRISGCSDEDTSIRVLLGFHRRLGAAARIDLEPQGTHRSSWLWVEDVVLLTIAGVGFCMTFFVAGRIAYVVGRVRKATGRSAEV